MADGDATYLRETGVAHLLQAAALQATAVAKGKGFDGSGSGSIRSRPATSGGDSTGKGSSRTVFASLVSPKGDLRISLPLYHDALLNAPKIHPALLRRFTRGVVDPAGSIPSPGLPMGLDARGHGAALAQTLQLAAERCVERGADLLPPPVCPPSPVSPRSGIAGKQRPGSAGTTGGAETVFPSAVLDIATGLRALSSMTLECVAPAGAPPGKPAATAPPLSPATPAPAAADADGGTNSPPEPQLLLHVDVALELPLQCVEPPVRAVEVLADTVAQLRWLLGHAASQPPSASLSADSPDMAKQYLAVPEGRPPSFHVHAALPHAPELSPHEHAALLARMPAVLAASPLRDVVTITKPGFRPALHSALAHRCPPDTNARVVVLMGADPRRFHVAGIGAALAACVTQYAPTMAANGLSALPAATGGPGGAGSPASVASGGKAARGKGRAAAAPSASAASPPAGSAAAGGAGASPGAVGAVPAEDKRTPFAFAATRRPDHYSHGLPREGRVLEHRVAPWLAPFVLQAPRPTFGAGVDSSSFTHMSLPSAEAGDPDAPGAIAATVPPSPTGAVAEPARLNTVCAWETAAAVIPFSAFAALQAAPPSPGKAAAAAAAADQNQGATTLEQAFVAAANVALEAHPDAMALSEGGKDGGAERAADGPGLSAEGVVAVVAAALTSLHKGAVAAYPCTPGSCEEVIALTRPSAASIPRLSVTADALIPPAKRVAAVATWLASVLGELAASLPEPTAVAVADATKAFLEAPPKVSEIAADIRTA